MKRIAIIEDDPAIGDMLQEVLQRERYQVERAYSGTEALYLLKERKPDLILLDLMLPGCNGYDVCRLIRDKVDVQRLIQKSRQPLEIAMDLKNQTLDYQAGGGEYFTGDMGWMCEAVGNIIKNCSEHTPEGGKITVQAEQTAVYTQISISDTGPGFSPQDLPNIFNRFYKGENSSTQSVGIGLAMARAIITGQNGTIKAENGNTGAKFIIKMYHSVL